MRGVRAAGCAMLAGLLASGTARASQTVWMGEAFVLTASDTCATLPVAAAGDYYRLIYRPKLNSTDPAEGLAFVAGRSDYLLIAQGTSLTFQGSGSYKGTSIGSRASMSTTTGAFQLTILPAPIQSGTDTLTVDGTVTIFSPPPAAPSPSAPP